MSTGYQSVYCSVCGIVHDSTMACGGSPTFRNPITVDFATAQAVAAERARCAKVARAVATQWPHGEDQYRWRRACEEVVRAIERGEG